MKQGNLMSFFNGQKKSQTSQPSKCHSPNKDIEIKQQQDKKQNIDSSKSIREEKINKAEIVSQDETPVLKSLANSQNKKENQQKRQNIQASSIINKKSTPQIDQKEENFEEEDEFVFHSSSKRKENTGQKRRRLVDSDEEIEEDQIKQKNETSEVEVKQPQGKKLKKANIVSNEKNKEDNGPKQKGIAKQEVTIEKKQEIIEVNKPQSSLIEEKIVLPQIEINDSIISAFQKKGKESNSKPLQTTKEQQSNTKPLQTTNSKTKEQESSSKPLQTTHSKTKEQELIQSSFIELPFEKSLISLKKDQYDPINDAPFLEGHDTPFGFLCAGFEIVAEQEGKNSKGAMIETISRIFKSIITLKPSQIYESYMFCILKIAPDYESNELGVGREILQKAISTCCGKSVTQIRDGLSKQGDLGKVAAQAKSTQKNISSFFVKTVKKVPPITLQRVFSDLKSIAGSSGQNSTSKREGYIMQFIRDGTPEEVCYFVRFIEGNLKIGAAEKTMQAALSKAFFELAHNIESGHTYTDTQEQLLEHFNFTITRCLCEFPNYRQVIETLKEIGTSIDELLNQCKITIGIPCKPMLAKPTKSIQIILDRFKDITFTCEYKYDGLRGQIHYDGTKVSIFSRNLEDMTGMYPDIVQFIQKHIGKSNKIQNFILDSEIVAFDKNTNRIKPFQSLATRGRVNVQLNEIDIKVCVFMFDLIYINDMSLLQTTLQERRQMITDHFVQEPGEFCFAEQLNTEDQEEIQEFLEKSVKVGCEGLMVKTLVENSTYEPAKRSFKWLKLKKDYINNGLGDTLDLVPIAAFKGTGKRTGVYGAYLLACYNEDMERYETICKIGTGFSDEVLDACFKFFQDKIIPQAQANYVIKDFKADVWFSPQIVWEIKGADLQISPVYTCAIGETQQDKGIGLRFPRLIRVRDDKRPIEATSQSFIYDLYSQQAVITNNIDDGDDFY